MIRKLLPVAAAGLALAGAGFALAATTTVNIARDGFRPVTRTINVGDTVVWRNQDAVHHQVVADNGTFASPILGPGGQYSFAFQAAGTYRYRDALEPAERATVVVRGLPPSISLALSAPVVTFAQQIHITGQVSNRRAGETVRLLAKPYPQGSFAEMTHVITGNDGVYDFLASPTILSEFQAQWGNASSIVARVEVRPRISIR
jgi:plastocyanin